MKKLVGLLLVIMLFMSSLAYAGGDKNRGGKGQGSTGGGGKGKVEQKRGG
jgi:hypothetical protein